MKGNEEESQSVAEGWQARVSKGEGGKLLVWDRLRRRRVRLTPEEAVRQAFVDWLVSVKGYPESLMANEVSLMVGGLPKRCDTVVYSPQDARPLMVIEYKAPNVTMGQAAVDQLCRYEASLRAPYLTLSNGRMTLCLALDPTSPLLYRRLEGVPDYSELVGR